MLKDQTLYIEKLKFTYKLYNFEGNGNKRKNPCFMFTFEKRNNKLREKKEEKNSKELKNHFWLVVLTLSKHGTVLTDLG